MTAQWMAGTVKPLEGLTELGTAGEWGEAVDDVAFKQGLRAAGFPESDIIEAAAVRNVESCGRRTRPYYDQYESDHYPEKQQYPGRHVRDGKYFYETAPVVDRPLDNIRWSRLVDWFSGRRVTVLETAKIPVRIPLFLLGCADVDGCTAVLSHEATKSQTLAWDMTIYGSGLSGSRDITTVVAAKFSAAAGQVKVIFLDLTLPVQRIEITKDGRTIGTGFQIDGANVQPAASPGLCLLSAASRPPTGGEITRFPLAGDTTGALSTYQWTYKRSTKMTATLGVKAFNSALTLNYGSTLTDQVSLTYELRGGHNYGLLAAAQGHGSALVA